MPSLLQDADSLCGLGPLNTGFYDSERPACGWHDNAYVNYKDFELLGWNRKDIDEYFLNLSLVSAGNNEYKISQAYRDYHLARLVGWAPYYYRKITGKTLWT